MKAKLVKESLNEKSDRNWRAVAVASGLSPNAPIEEIKNSIINNLDRSRPFVGTDKRSLKKLSDEELIDIYISAWEYQSGYEW